MSKFVYLVRNTGTGNIKIGKATDCEDRLSGLQTGSDSLLSIVMVIQSKDAAALERGLHQRYEHLRIRGEWFALTEEAVEEIRRDHLRGCLTGPVRRTELRMPRAERIGFPARTKDPECEWEDTGWRLESAGPRGDSVRFRWRRGSGNNRETQPGIYILGEFIGAEAASPAG